MKVRILEPRRLPAAAGRLVMLVVGGVGLFLSAATLFEPGASRADQSSGSGSSGRAHQPGAAIDPGLGVLVGRETSITIKSTPLGPRYSVLDALGNPLATDLHADEVYREFPELDVQTLQAAPLMMATEPRD